MPVSPRLTNPSLLRPLADWLWWLAAGVAVIAIDFLYFGVDVFSDSAGLSLLCFVCVRLRREASRPGTRLVALASAVWFGIGVVVELPQTFGAEWNALWPWLLTELYRTGMLFTLGALTIVIANEGARFGFEGVATAWGACALVSLASACVSLADLIVFLQSTPEPSPMAGFTNGCLIASSLILVPLSLLAAWVTGRAGRARPKPIKLATTPEGKCRYCSYDLAGLTGSICPECGTTFRRAE